jgi:hypothetical protein
MIASTERERGRRRDKESLMDRARERVREALRSTALRGKLSAVSVFRALLCYISIHCSILVSYMS